MKNKTNILFIVLVFSISFVNAQVFDIYGYSNLHTGFEDNNSIIGLDANYFQGSTSIKNSFSNAIMNGDFIDDDMKKSASLKDNNMFGSHLQTNIYYASMQDSLFGMADLGMRFGLNYYSMQNMSFSNDFYNVLMYGNKQFEGKIADFSGLDINRVLYQSFEFGFFKRIDQKDSGYHTVYFGLSFIKGQEYLYLYADKANFYTAPDGEYIDLDITSSYFASDSVSSNLATVSGLGASLNFYWAYEDVKHNSRFEITFSDLGLVSWYKNPLYYTADTLIHFNGQEVNDIMNNPTTKEITQDSILQQIYSNSDNKTFNKSLPKRFQFTYTKRFLNNKYIPTVGLGYYFNSNQFMPAFFLNNRFVMSPLLSMDFMASYGGYTGFGIGLGIGFEVFKGFRVNVASSNIVGVIMPDKSYSQSAFIKIDYAF